MIENVPIPDGLNDRQRLFCEEYVMNGGNATKAYRAAKYECTSTNSWTTGAFQILTNSNVIAYIEALRKAVRQDFAVTAEEVIGSLRTARERGFSDEEVFDREGNRTGEYKNDLPSAIRATELLGKTRGMFIDRQEITLDLEGIADKLSGEMNFMEGRT